MRRGGEIQLSLIQRRDHFHQPSLVCLVAAAKLEADAILGVLHRGIVGAELDFPQRAEVGRDQFRDVGVNPLRRCRQHGAIFAIRCHPHTDSLDAGGYPQTSATR